MDTDARAATNAEKTKCTRIGIRPELEVSNYIPDFIQKTIIEQMDRIEAEILKHEEAITSLEALYISHANFLKRYSPLAPDDGNLSQMSLSTGTTSPEAMPPAERRAVDEENVQAAT